MDSLHILIPCFNEQECIRTTVESLIKSIENLDLNYSILLYNDGSTDSTGGICDLLSSEYSVVAVHHSPLNQNLGAAFKYAISFFNDGFLTWLPADGELSPKVVKELWRARKKGVVPFVNPIQDVKIRGVGRTCLSFCFQWIFRTSFNIDVSYLNGPSLLPIEELKEYRILSEGFTIHAELLIFMKRLGYRFKEIKTTLYPRGNGKSKAIKINNMLFITKAYFFLLIRYRVGNE